MRCRRSLAWASLCALLCLCAGLVARPARVHAAQTAAVPPAGDRDRGEQIFRHGVNASPPCITCHQVTTGGFSLAIGPNLVGIAANAGSRIEGMTAEQYLEDSILHPGHHLVSGYRDLMYPDFAKHFSAQDLADLIAFLKTL